MNRDKINNMCRYSEKNSKKFWKDINSKKGKDKDYLYTMGVILQNVEDLVLSELYKVEGD